MVVLVIVSTMLVGTWISLQRAFGYARADTAAGATGRDALSRISSELRAAQPNPSGTPASSTSFVLTLTAPYVCDANDCVFYSAYNNSGAAAQSGSNGTAQLRLTAIWLDTSGSAAQKKLYWQRDTNGDGALGSGDIKILLADNVVNTALSPVKPIFQYVLRDSSTYPPIYTFPTSLTSTNVALLVAVNIELVVDANLAHTPTYVDLVSTVRPRNAGTN
jgi:type II secretory pathway pseudopilin PulG